MSVSILSYISLTQHAAIAARTSTYDASGDFQTAIDALHAQGGGTLYIPAGKYRLNSTITNKKHVSLLGDGPTASTLEWPSGHTGHGIQQLAPINGATQVNNRIEKIGLYSLAGESSVGGAFYERGGTQVKFYDCQFYRFRWGAVLDQSEIVDIRDCDFVESMHSCLWIANGYEAALGNTGAAGGYTNIISVMGCQFNVPVQFAILDDGGVGHNFIDNSFNGGGSHIRAAGVGGLVIQGNYLEAATNRNIYFSNYTLSNVASGPCSHVLIAGNSIFPSAGNYSIQSGSLGRLTLINNGFGNNGNASVAAVNCYEMNAVYSIGNATENTGGMFQNAPYVVRWSAEALIDGSATADVGSIAAGASAYVNVTATGAAVGDRVDFVAASIDLGDDITLSGRVSAANTVRVKLTNSGSGAVDPASCVYSVRVEKKQI
jgi:polygalacturonase